MPARKIKSEQRVLLVILDGWGLNPKAEGNAIAMANTPAFDDLLTKFPNTELIASGEAIDLPPGRMGNSEVGHQNIGAGRVVPQASTMITRAIRSGTFFDGRKIIPKAMLETKKHNGKLHLFGLLSDGLVHSHIEHAFALLKLAKKVEIDCIIHPLLDGRDVPPMSALDYLGKIENLMKVQELGWIGTLAGRVVYERDHKKWHLVEKLYNLMVNNSGSHARSAREAVEDAYSQGVTIDEHIPPYVIVDDNDEPISKLAEGDLIINWNFRGDRATMISHALVDTNFTHFKRKIHPKINYICMSLYDDDIPAPVAFPPVKLHSVLSEMMTQSGMKQFKIAETTKFFHLTFFFNCRRRKPFPGESQVMIPSKRTQHYDEVPEMSALEVGDGIINALSSTEFDFLAVNFANPDMVGHTGNLEAAIKAVETVDVQLGRVVQTAKDCGYSTIVTADHGNADQMVDYLTGKPHTAHTANKVPFILILNPEAAAKLEVKTQCDPSTTRLCSDGLLGNIAPTILDIMGLSKPPEMTCDSLVRAEGH